MASLHYYYPYGTTITHSHGHAQPFSCDTLRDDNGIEYAVETTAQATPCGCIMQDVQYNNRDFYWWSMEQARSGESLMRGGSLYGQVELYQWEYRNPDRGVSIKILTIIYEEGRHENVQQTLEREGFIVEENLGSQILNPDLPSAAAPHRS